MFMMVKYGPEVIAEIEALRCKILPWHEFRDCCEKYKKINKEMLSEKGFA
jgi:hypothetical protein